MPNRVICGTCQARWSLPSEVVQRARPQPKGRITVTSPDATQRVFEYAIREILYRHQQEFKDICIVELDRRNLTGALSNGKAL